MTRIPDWARALGPPLFVGRIRSTPSDFDVTELLDIEFSGDGEHDWLYVEKTGANTHWVAEQLAKYASVRQVDVGYAGLKDRHAVTRQWFSVRRPSLDGTDWDGFDVEGVSILDSRRHRRKLKRGAHRGNAFRIAVRSPEIADLQNEIDVRLRYIATTGVPNYFGEQRFGRDGANVQLGQAIVRGKRVPRHKRSIGISALRSYRFNEELDARVREGDWNRLLAGDVHRPLEAVPRGGSVRATPSASGAHDSANSPRHRRAPEPARSHRGDAGHPLLHGAARSRAARKQHAYDGAPGNVYG